MPRFHYHAIDQQQQALEGHIESADVKSAASALERQGLTLRSIRQVEISPTPEPTSPFAEKAESPSSDTAGTWGSERQSLQRQHQQVLRGGKRLAPALKAYALELPPGRQRRTLQRIARQLVAGDAAALSPQLDEGLLPLLSASASTGDPTLILSGLVDESLRSGAARRQLRLALAYPMFLLVVILAITSFFSWLITPVYQEIFRDFGLELPAVTRSVLGFHQQIRETYGLPLLAPLVLLFGAFIYLWLCRVGLLRARLLHLLPGVGAIFRLAAQSKFCRYLADLVQAEVPVADALRISGRNTGHCLLREEANTLAARVEMGATNLAEVPLLNIPNTALHVCQSNTKPTAGARILRELSSTYDQQLNYRLSLAANIIEPLFVLMLGIGVGVHVIALMMPLINLVQNLT